MALKTDDAKKLIELKKAKIELQEKLLKEKEKKMKVRRSIKIGSMMLEMGLDHLDDVTLKGAIIELSNMAKNDQNLSRWIELGKEYESKDELQALIVTFENSESDQPKEVLKEMKFKWNKFRKEWYGYGSMESIQEKLSEFNAKVKVVVA